jgi:hypothetical protein
MALPELNPHLPSYQRRVKELWRLLPMFASPPSYAAGAIVYSTSSGIALSAAGTAGQALISGGTGAPTWFAGTQNGVIYASGASGILASTAQGAANSVLTANAGAPAFSATPTVTSLTTTGSLAVGGAITSTIGGTFFVGSGSTTGQTNLQFANTGGSAQIGIDQSTGAGLAIGALAYSTIVGATTNTPLHLVTNSNVRMTIAAGGSVGIGTTGPGKTLDIAGTLQASGQITQTGGGTFFVGSGATTGQTNLQFSNTGGTTQLGIDSSAGGVLGIGTLAYSTVLSTGAANTAIHLITNSSVRMTVANTGSVGIAMIPVRTLDVTGTFGATGNSVIGGTLLVSGALTNSTLTSGRVLIAGTSGLIGDDADLTFSVDTLTATKISTTSVTDSGLTSGRVPFASTGGLLIDDVNMTFGGGGLDTLTLTKLSLGAVVNSTGLAHGTYTPTLTGVANTSSTNSYKAQYMRVGNTVTVSGQLDVDPTLTATLTKVGISLPIASNFAAGNDCAGAAFASNIAGQGAAIVADSANDRAQMQWIATDVTNQPMLYCFSYEVI